jgi:hypothetical protein
VPTDPLSEAKAALRDALRRYATAVSQRYAADPYFTQRQALAAFSEFRIPRAVALKLIRAKARRHNEALKNRRRRQ